MNISCVESNSAINLLNLQGSTKPKSVKNDGLQEVSDCFSKSDETQKFKEIVGKYDITNMSRNEATEMYKELYDNGLISLKDMLVTFDPFKQANDIKQATGIDISNGITISGWKISADPNEKMNFLDGLKTQSEWNKKHGNSEFQQRYDERLELAEKIKYFQS